MLNLGTILAGGTNKQVCNNLSARPPVSLIFKALTIHSDVGYSEYNNHLKTIDY